MTATPSHTKRPRRLCAEDAPMKNPSRERLKTELSHLRSQVAALEAQLFALQEQQHHHHQQLQPRVDLYVTRDRDDDGYDREDARDRRRASELENRRLRAMLWRQIRACRRTIAALTGQAPDALGAGALFSLAPLTVQRASQLHDDYGHRFAVLRDDVDRAFGLLGDVVAAAAAAASGAFATTVQSRVFGQPEQQLALAKHDVDVIAFDVARASAALWRAIMPEAFGFWDAHVRDVGADAKAVRLSALDAVDGATVQLTCSLVVKRFDLDGGCVAFVWRSITTSDASDEDAYFDETGWTLFSRAEEEEEAEERTAGEWTHKRTFVQWVPRSVAPADDSDRAVALAPKTGELGRIVVAMTRQDTQSITESMENLLIDDCMGATAASPRPAAQAYSGTSRGSEALLPGEGLVV